jgi:carboxylesterase
VPLLPGAEPFRHEGGEVGVVLSHGFTGCPHSMRPWAEHLAKRGLTVSLPLLPGHGTRWQDMQHTTWHDWYAAIDREIRSLSERCRKVFVFGLSMGGGLALHAAARHGDAVAGVALVNPSVRADQKLIAAVPVLRHLVPSVDGIKGDVAKEGVEEAGYTRVPLHALYSLTRFWKTVREELPQVTQPVLLMRSPQDHVVSPENSGIVLARISSADVTEVVLERSYHVATLDHDAERIFESSWDFVRRLAPQAALDGAGSG